jgi:hypothetical protein
MFTDDDECGTIGAMLGKGTRITRWKPAPVPLSPPKIPHYFTRASAMGSWRLIACAMARPNVTSCSLTRFKLSPSTNAENESFSTVVQNGVTYNGPCRQMNARALEKWWPKGENWSAGRWTCSVPAAWHDLRFVCYFQEMKAASKGQVV